MPEPLPEPIEELLRVKERPDAKTVELHDNIQQAVVDFEHDLKSHEKPLEDLLRDSKIPLPAWSNPYEPSSKRRDKVVFIYTDLEPDDIFAIACYLQSTSTRPCAPPVVVFTADLGVKGKDKGSVLEKKLMLATFALGYDFMKRLRIVSHAEENLLRKPHVEDAEDAARDRDLKLGGAVQDFVALAKCRSNASLEFFVMAPGRGNLGIIQKKLDEEKLWSVAGGLREQASVHIYSGSFNIKGMEKEDFDMIVETTKYGREPIMDVSHFPYVGGERMLEKISNLAPFCPKLGNILYSQNPYLAQAWQMYAEKFDKDLLDPFKTEEPEKRKDYPDDTRGEDHPLLARLWCEDVRKLEGDIKALASKKQSGDGLTTEQTDELERLGVRLADCQESANLLREKFKKNFWDYVVELQKSPLLGMIRFKKRIVVSLAKYGFHEGPLCDCLCYLNEWMLKTNKKEKVDTSSKGKWWYCIDGKAPSGVGNPSNAGYTQQGVDDEGKELWYQKDKKVVLVVTEADAVCPKLKDPRDSKLVDAMSEELQTRILKSTCLKEVKKSQSDILNDAFFRVVDEDFSRVFLTDRQDGYRGLVDSEGDIPEDDEFAFFDDNIRNAMVKSTAQKFNSAKTKLKSSSILRKMSHASRNEDDEDDEDDEQNTRDPMNPDPKQATAKSHSHDVNTASDLSMTKLMRAIDEKNKDTFRDWKQKWLPELFMKNIQEFNWRSVKFAGRQFLRGLRRNPVYLESLPPEGSSSNFENNWDEKIIHLSISADTQFVLIASKEKVEMERIEDLQPVLKYRPKSEEDIQAVACLSKLGEDVQLLAIVLPESIQLVAFTVDSESPTVWETKRSELYVSSGGQGPGSAENPNITSASFSADGEYLALAGKQKDDGGTDYGRVDVFSTAWIYEHRIDNDLPKKTRKLSLANFSSKSIAPSEKDDHHELPLGSKDHIADFLQKARGGTDLWTSGSQLRESKRKQDSCSNGLFYIYRRAPVNSIGWSPRGDRIVLGADNKSSALYVLPKTDDPEDWRKKWTRLGGKSFFEIPSDGKVVDTAFSGDGCRLCVARSMSVDIYDAVHGSFIGNIALHRTVYSAVFTQDGTRIAITCRNEDEAVQIFDANAQTQLYKKPFKGGARKVSFSPCGTFLVASGGRDEGEVRIVRPETGGVSYQKERSDAVGAIASSSDGKYFAFGFGKGPGRVEVAITKSGHIIHSHLVDKTARVVSFACMEVDGEVREVLLSLSSASKESKIHIRELDSWEHKLTLVFPGEITSMASTKHFLAIALNVNLKSPGGEKLASIQDDTFVYDAFTSSPGKASDDAEELPKHHKHSPWLIPWKSLSSEVAVELDATTLTLAAMRPFPSLGNNIMTVDVVVPSINDGELQPMIAYGGLDKKAHIYDIPMRRWYEDDLRRAGVLKRYPSILYEADDKGGNAKAMLRERSRHTFSFNDVVRACCFSPNGDKFAVGGSMEIVAVYHTNHGERLFTILPKEDVYSLAFSVEGSYLAIGAEKIVTIADVMEKNENSLESSLTPPEILRLNRGSRAYVAFVCEEDQNGQRVPEDESKLVAGSWDHTVTVFEKLLTGGAPIAALDEDPSSIDLALKLNPLLPIITRFEVSLVDRSLLGVFRASGSLKKEKYNTIEHIMNMSMGPMAIQPRHFLLAIVERDPHLLVMLLKGATSPSAPLRLRFDTVKMIPYIIQNDLEAALAEAFRDLPLEDTGCEIHAIDCTFSFMAECLRGIRNVFFGAKNTKPIVDEMLLNMKWRKSGEEPWWRRLRSFCQWFFIGGRREKKLTTDVITANAEFDHFYPWRDFVEDDKGVLARPHRVPLPALASRCILSHMVQIKGTDVANSLFGSTTMHNVIRSVYDKRVRFRHIFWTFFFAFQIFCWFTFCMKVKYHRNLEKKIGKDVFGWVPGFPADVCLLVTALIFIMWHELRQQCGECERALGTDRSDYIALSKSLLKRGLHTVAIIMKPLINLLIPLLWVMDFFSTTRETNTQSTSIGWNLCDWFSQFFVGISALSVLLARFLPYSKEELYIQWWFLPFLALTSILLLGKTISYLRGFRKTAWLTVVIVKAIIDIKEFLTICIVIIFFFCVAFTMLTANLKIGGSHEDYGDGNSFDDDTILNLDRSQYYGIDDDTILNLDRSFFDGLVDMFAMGMLGDFSTTSFDFSSQRHVTQLLFMAFMLLLQIVALNALIAILSESFSEVLVQKNAKINMMLAQLMVEYMDCWAECPTRLGGTLLELEQENLWTHILKISDDDNLGDITPIDQVKLKIYSVYDKVRKLEDDFALEQLRTSGERDEIKRKLDTGNMNATWQRRNLKKMLEQVEALDMKILKQTGNSN